MAVGLDAEDDELVVAGHLALVEEEAAPEVRGHAEVEVVVRVPAAAVQRGRLAPGLAAVPDQFLRPVINFHNICFLFKYEQIKRQLRYLTIFDLS